jgi:hypothetical protein
MRAVSCCNGKIEKEGFLCSFLNIFTNGYRHEILCDPYKS